VLKWKGLEKSRTFCYGKDGCVGFPFRLEPRKFDLRAYQALCIFLALNLKKGRLVLRKYSPVAVLFLLSFKLTLFFLLDLWFKLEISFSQLFFLTTQRSFSQPVFTTERFILRNTFTIMLYSLTNLTNPCVSHPVYFFTQEPQTKRLKLRSIPAGQRPYEIHIRRAKR
jgi:hypothetical protein